MNAPLYPYLGYNEAGQLALYVSITQLNIIGTRLERPNSKFPPEVIAFHNDPRPENATKALEVLRAFLNGEIKGATGLEFGQAVDKKRTRKTR